MAAYDHRSKSLVCIFPPVRVVSVLTSEVMLHKNPTVRGTVSRLLAYVTDRVGPDKVLSGQKDLTDKVRLWGLTCGGAQYAS